MGVPLGFWVGNEYGTSVFALLFSLGTASMFLDFSCLTGVLLGFLVGDDYGTLVVPGVPLGFSVRNEHGISVDGVFGVLCRCCACWV